MIKSDLLAARIIHAAGWEQPVDTVLRSELKQARGLSPAASRQVARMVFAYHRWLGWLKKMPDANILAKDHSLAPDSESKPAIPKQISFIQEQLRQAFDLQLTFNRDPNRVSTEELHQKAIPKWINEHLAVSPMWLRALQQEPLLWLRARPGRGAALAQQLQDCIPVRTAYLPDCLRYTGREDLFRTPQFQAGEFELQDISSQLVGLLCAPQPRETWWDACAGEGGKTLHLADLMNNQGLIWATDRATWRLQRLKRRAARARIFNYRTAVWQDETHLPTRTRFDGVLIDAPCSGVGTWQRNPQARWTITPADVQELAAVQQRLLALAATAVKPGGKLIYAVCTLTRQETVEVATTFQQNCQNFVPLPVNHPLAPNVPATAQHWFWPQDYGGNGMFVALWRRIS